MFKKTRRKIVAAIMAVLVFLWVGTLGIIYGSSYYEVSNRNREMLNRHVELYMPEPLPDLWAAPDERRPDREGPHFEDTPAFQLSTFYSVAVSKEGKTLEVNNPHADVRGNEELEQIAREVIKEGKERGIKNNLIYRMEEKGGYILVAFMDNTIMRESMTTLFRYTVIFGGIVLVVLFFLAVYLARKIVEPLEESYQRQKQFISDAGHELKTPVAVVSANAELLSREIGGNQWLANIQYENERMGTLVGQLLELARTEQVAFQMEMIDMGRLTCGEALPFESVIFESGLTFRCQAADHLYVNGDGAKLRQLVSILLDNAVSHCKKGGEVSLTLKSERNQAVLSVANDGEEIPEKRQKQIFERFYRADEARDSEGKHYGLGLAIAKTIVTAHGGKIQVGWADGKVEFKVRLPLQK